MRKLLALSVLALSMGSASAASWMIGDNDGYGAGIPDNGDHNFNGFTANYDGRSAAEMAATDGAQYTDTYSTTHPGFGPQPGTVATFTFSGLSAGWTQGSMWFDMADFQASTFGAVLVTFNGIVQNWAFNDGFPHTKVRFFNLDQNVLDSINNTGALIIKIDRNQSSDFYGFDYALLSDVNAPVPEPSTYAMMGLGLGALGLMARRRRNKA
jgi:hypothetical protein